MDVSDAGTCDAWVPPHWKDADVSRGHVKVAEIEFRNIIGAVQIVHAGSTAHMVWKLLF